MVQLLLVPGVVLNRLKHVIRQTYVAQEIILYLLCNTLGMKVYGHLLSVRVASFIAFHISQMLITALRGGSAGSSNCAKVSNYL